MNLKTRLRKAADDLPGRCNELTTKAKPALLLALGTQTFWLTPSSYRSLRYTSQWWRVLICIWIAAAAWVFATGMLMPQMQQYTEVAVNRIGPQFGYWDPRFAGKAAKVLITSVCAFIVASLAVFDWLTVHAARLIDRLTQIEGSKPPPFGYFATTVAGNMVGLSVLTGLIAFAAQPLSTPAWRWFSHPGGAQSLVIVFAAGAAYLGHVRWQEISARRDQEIFGSRLKGFLARTGTCLVGFGILLAFAHPL